MQTTFRVFAFAVLARVLTPSAFAAEAPRIACDTAVSSNGAKARITFVNYALSPAKLYWIDTVGQKHLQATLEAGKTVLMDSYEGHIWQLAWADSDACVFGYRTLAVPSVVSFAGAWVQSLPCSAELASPKGTAPSSKISFRNSTTETLSINWVDYSTTRQRLATLAPGQTTSLNSTAGHLFVATNDSGDCRGVFRAHDDLWADVR